VKRHPLGFGTPPNRAWFSLRKNAIQEKKKKRKRGISENLSLAVSGKGRELFSPREGCSELKRGCDTSKKRKGGFFYLSSKRGATVEEKGRPLRGAAVCTRREKGSSPSRRGGLKVKKQYS